MIGEERTNLAKPGEIHVITPRVVLTGRGEPRLHFNEGDSGCQGYNAKIPNGSPRFGSYVTKARAIGHCPIVHYGESLGTIPLFASWRCAHSSISTRRS